MQNATAPGGIGVATQKINGLVVGINLAEHSLDIVNPSGGGVYTVDVTDPARQAMLSSLKVGDTKQVCWSAPAFGAHRSST